MMVARDFEIDGRNRHVRLDQPEPALTWIEMLSMALRSMPLVVERSKTMSCQPLVASERFIQVALANS